MFWFCADIWMSSAVVASQSTEDGSIISQIPASGSVSDDTGVTALEQRLLADVDSWTASFSNSSASFPGGGMLLSSIATDDSADGQSAIMWHVPEDKSQTDVDSMLQSVTSTQTERTDIATFRPPAISQPQIRHMLADSIKHDSTRGVNVSLLSQLELCGSNNQVLQQPFGSSADSNVAQVLNVGQLSAKRRSSDNYPCTSDSMVVAHVPKQRANSMHAVVQSGTQNVSLDRSGGNGRQDDHSFVAPRQPQQQPSGTRVLQSDVGRHLVGGRTSLEPSCRQQSVIGEKAPENGSAVTKHVTFTDQKVIIAFVL